MRFLKTALLISGVLLPLSVSAQTVTLPPVDWSSNGFSYINKAGYMAGLNEDGYVTAPSSGSVDLATLKNIPLTQYLTNEAVGHYTVFLGSANHLNQVSTNVDTSLGTNRIALYLHGNGVVTPFLAKVLLKSKVSGAT